MKRARLLRAALALTALTSCAYWNTFYLARQNYDRATLGEPYLGEFPVRDGIKIASARYRPSPTRS